MQERRSLWDPVQTELMNNSIEACHMIIKNLSTRFLSLENELNQVNDRLSKINGRNHVCRLCNGTGKEG